MPELLSAEASFAILYADGGRPNWSVARVLGVCLLQQLQDMSDQQALDALSFDLRWQHALDITAEQSYLSRRSLVEFRRRLVQHDADGSLLRAVFDRICRAGVCDLGLDTSEQRLDSTLVASNIRAHGRLSLARETLRLFVRSLDDVQRSRLPEAVTAWDRNLSADSWAHDGDRGGERTTRLHELGVLVQQTLDAFATDATVSAAQPYGLLRRLLDEHGAALGLTAADGGAAQDEDSPDPPDDPPLDGSAQVASRRTRKPKTGRHKPHAARYWSPHDPDASFGHKGLGYHVHIAETCRNGRTELLTDYAIVTAAQSDIGQSLPALQRLADLAPTTMYADGGYPTPADLVDARRLGTELCAPVNRGKLPVDSMSRADFDIDVATHRVVHCPAGQSPTRHGERESSDSMQPRRALFAFFDAQTCNACPQRPRCPVRQPNNARSREYRIELSDEIFARDARWVEQQSEPWRARYRIRAGIEATMSELKRGHGLGRLRVRTHARVQIQIALKTTSCNVKRWIRGWMAVLCALCSVLFDFWRHLRRRLGQPVARFRTA